MPSPRRRKKSPIANKKSAHNTKFTKPNADSEGFMKAGNWRKIKAVFNEVVEIDAPRSRKTHRGGRERADNGGFICAGRRDKVVAALCRPANRQLQDRVRTRSGRNGRGLSGDAKRFKETGRAENSQTRVRFGRSAQPFSKRARNSRRSRTPVHRAAFI